MNSYFILTFVIFTFFSSCQGTGRRSTKEVRQFLLDISKLAKEDFSRVTRFNLSDEKDERIIQIQPAHFMNNKPRSLGKTSWRNKTWVKTKFRFWLSWGRGASSCQRGRQHYCGQYQCDPPSQVWSHRWWNFPASFPRVQPRYL